MLAFLINRPIAILMSLLALIIFSVMALWQLPISLLPETDVPRLSILVNYPNAGPAQIEENALAIIRQRVSTAARLNAIESTANYEQGRIDLTFEFDTDMNLAYIEINEKIDQLSSSFPQEMDRPLVVKSSSNDIPILAIQVVPEDSSQFLDVSQLTEFILKKRIEQIEGVSLVDINGLQKQVISISPFTNKMDAVGVDMKSLISSIQKNNQELGGISVQDGQYRYLVKITNPLKDEKSLADLPIRLKNGQIIKLSELATVGLQLEHGSGFHIYNNRVGLVIAVHKQATARMNELSEKVKTLVNEFKSDYPQASFSVTRDQSKLLTLSIDNLLMSLAFGGLFSFLVLFIFMGNIQMPLIMGISLPTSLLLSFLVFSAFGISINIISISGLALGLGMLIDNAIIVLDNIHQKRRLGTSAEKSSIQGANEVMPALTSSTLTTLAVFVPLIFIGGITGALFYDQAVSIAAILSVSLLVAFILIPLLYLLFTRRKTSLAEDSKLQLRTLTFYKKTYNWSMSHKSLTLTFILSAVFLAVYSASSLKVESLPIIDSKEKLITIDWNQSIDAYENRRRVSHWLKTSNEMILNSESDIGLTQFILNAESSTVKESRIYVTIASEYTIEDIVEPLKQLWPSAEITFSESPNAFDQLFSSNLSYWIAKVRNGDSDSNIKEKLNDHFNQSEEYSKSVKSTNDYDETSVQLGIDRNKLILYDVDESEVLNKLNVLFSNYLVTEIKQFGSTLPVILQASNKEIRERLNTTFIYNAHNESYPLSGLINIAYSVSPTTIKADWSGPYTGIEFNEVENSKRLEKAMSAFAIDNNVVISYEGQYYENQKIFKRFTLIFTISALLLYFILVAQFESFTQPLIVILTLPIGFAGSILFLFISGTSLNVMSGIGVIVMLGIIVNDSILKIDTINRLRSAGLKLDQAIEKAGAMRLKPILMTSITTILAVLPLLFASGLGATLQQPLVNAIIGGLVFGTIASLFFIPIAYKAFTK